MATSVLVASAFLLCVFYLLSERVSEAQIIESSGEGETSTVLTFAATTATIVCQEPCKTCSSLTACLTCVDGYYKDPTAPACNVCPSPCVNCTSASNCNACKKGNYLASGACTTCPATCAECVSNSSCSLCNAGYYLTSSTCTACPTSCAECASSSSCTICKAGYYLLSGACNDCPATCSECTSSSICTACKPTYYLANSRCTQCLSPCKECTGQTSCLTCVDGFYKDPTSSACYACHSTCTTCAFSGRSACYSCATGFYLAGMTCNPCSSSCSACSGSDGSICSACSPGYYLLGTTCYPCQSPCITCSASGNTACFSCISGYFNSQNKCNSCSSNCIRCTSGALCQQCDTGYYLSGGSCIKCDINCNNCQASGCISCAVGYILSGGSCAINPCTDPMKCSQNGLCQSTGSTPFFICSCFSGFYGNTCANKSPCITNPTQCNRRGTCLPTVVSPYFSCLCLSGYTGTTCDKAQVPTLYPYGRSMNDFNLFGTDDGTTPRISFNQGFLFFGHYVTSGFVNMNGFMSFEANYMSYTPYSFPHFDGIQIDLISPFWADADSSGVYYDNGMDVVYYHVYQRNQFSSAADMLVFDIASADGQQFFNNPTFSAGWVMVVTWSQVIPWPYYSNLYSSERNTFQMVLVMDSILVKSFVAFRYGYLGWNPIRAAVAGYQTINLDFINLPSIYTLANYQQSSTSAKGVRMFDTTGRVPTDMNSICLQWLASQKVRISSLQATARTLPPCPCSAFLAVFSPNHAWLPGTNCFATITRWTYMGMLCCYDVNYYQWAYQWYQWSWVWTWVWLGNLITIPAYSAGGLYDYNPLYYYSPTDTNARKYCCLYSNNCAAFFESRPLDRCERYVPPRIGVVFGDPHITTLDGLEYDYNGIGEYWMIKSSVVSLQARTLVAWDSSGKPVNASVFAAFGVQIPNGPEQNMSDRVFVEMNDQRNGLMLLAIRADNDNSKAENLTSWLRNETSELASSENDTRSDYKGIVLSRLKEGLIITLSTGSQLILRLQEGQISVTTTASDNLINNTMGLMGTLNNDITDDFLLKDGITVLPSNSPPEQIFSIFGENWRLVPGESIMWYSPTKPADTFQATNFVPIFRPSFASSAEAAAAARICGNNTRCLLDFAATGNPALASVTANTTRDYDQTRPVITRNLPIITGNDSIKVTVGQTFTTVYKATDADGNRAPMSMTGLPSGARFNAETGEFTWTPSNSTPVTSLGIIANDTITGLSSAPFNIYVFLCDCHGRGNCAFDNIIANYSGTYRFQIVECICQLDYFGIQCTEIVNHCSDNPCGINATCESITGRLNEFNRSFTCSNCPSSQTLTLGKCQKSESIQLDIQNKQSTCFSSPCINGGSCQGDSTGYNCSCLTGYKGTNCEIEFNVCVSQPCQNGGTCSSTTPSQYNCSCATGFSGKNCEIVQNDCGQANPCVNGAACVLKNMATVCLCAPGYTGSMCQVAIDNCQSQPCLNKGTCINNNLGFSCKCQPGFTGTVCTSSVGYKLSTTVKVKIGQFVWSDDLRVSSSSAYKTYETRACGEMKRAYGNGIVNLTYDSCSAIEFRQGSVFPILYVTFLVSANNKVDSQALADSMKIAIQVMVLSSNPLAINAQTMQVNVLTYGVTDLCYNSSCHQVCTSSSSSNRACSCFRSFTLQKDNVTCTYVPPVPSTVSDLTIAIAIPAGFVGSISFIMLIVAYLYSRYKGFRVVDTTGERQYVRRRSDEEDTSDSFRFTRGGMTNFGFARSEDSDWRSDRGEDVRRRSQGGVITWRLPRLMFGDQPQRADEINNVNFRRAKMYQPHRISNHWMPITRSDVSQSDSLSNRRHLARPVVRPEVNRQRDTVLGMVGKDDHPQRKYRDFGDNRDRRSDPIRRPGWNAQGQLGFIDRSRRDYDVAERIRNINDRDDDRYSRQRREKRPEKQRRSPEQYGESSRDRFEDRSRELYEVRSPNRSNMPRNGDHNRRT